MPMLDNALELAQRGFFVFPVQSGAKEPAVKDWPNAATTDLVHIRKWFAGTDRNVGIATGKFGDGQALVVIDIDNKDGKSGDESLLMLELEGHDFPPTMEQSTPSGGGHLIYVVDRPLKQGVNVLGPGLDVRSRGGYIVGPGSQIDGVAYALTRRMLPVPAPAWLVDRLGAVPERAPAGATPVGDVDPGRAAERAIKYLKTAPVATEGEGGDSTTYKVAAKLKDLGLTEEQAFQLMLEHWNDRCDPPWGVTDIADKIDHAYRYGREQPGISAPEAVFPKADPEAPGQEGAHPADALNKEYAFIKRGAFVLQETTDEDGRFATMRLAPNDLHSWFANKTMQVGDKPMPLSKLWMTRKNRREYESVVFQPQQTPDPRFYNLWRGFSVEPQAGEHESVRMFLDHALNNVCGSDKALCRWLIGFFAHMIQRPWEKPLVALVFRGKKGTGKNALVERVGELLGHHFMVTDDERYLMGNFNAHMEHTLFFVLDEANWAGDKRAEGKLKGLITGKAHNIERKGDEVYRAKNLTRVAVVGNEKWLVPATQDERRFAVFNVGDGRKQDRQFFQQMRVGMEQGGYACLLHYLQNFDISDIDVNWAPDTEALTDQKHATLEPLQEWWHDCISSNQLVGSEWEGDLPPTVPTNRMRQAFEAWARSRNIRSRLPGRNDFVKQLAEMAKSMPRVKARPDEPGDATYSWKNPGLDALREDWEGYIGGKVSWT